MSAVQYTSGFLFRFAVFFKNIFLSEWVKLSNNELTVTTLRYELIEPILSTLKHIDVYSKFHINYKHDISV